MKTIMMLLAIVLFYADSISQTVINEVMYSPSDATNEWFELYNNSAEQIDIKNWKWKDATSTLRNITSQSLIIQPQSFIIICQDSAKLKQQFAGIPARIIQTSWSPLNNSGDNLIIIDANNFRVDSLVYASGWGGGSGRSLERINPSAPSNLSSNWGTTQNTAGGTPGSVNSITPKPYDLNLTSFRITPAVVHPGDTIFFSAAVRNSGLNVLNDISFRIFFDANNDSTAQTGEQISLQNAGQLNAADSTGFLYNIIAGDTGIKQYIAVVMSSSPDDDSTNNHSVQRIKVSDQTSGISGILINEIMYSPASGEPEWVEIFNGTSDAADINNWKIADSSSQSDPHTIIQVSKLVPPGEFLILTKSSAITANHPSLDTNKIVVFTSFPTLNNDKDKIILYNEELEIIDQINYHSTWGGNNGHSIERMKLSSEPDDSTAWATSIDCERSTPGRENSMNGAVANGFNDLIINEIMFDPLTGSSEWIEFYNRSGRTLLLTGWSLSDASSEYIVADTCSYFIEPGDYFLLCKDSSVYNSFPELLTSATIISFDDGISLSNDGEQLLLSGVLGETVDSVFYSGKWHNSNLTETKGISIERISHNYPSNDRSNWSSSASLQGGTPGKANSIDLTARQSESQLSISPNPFSPDGDGHEDFTEIKFTLDVSFSQMRMKVYDIKGRLVREILNNQYTAGSGSVIFDGMGDDGQRLRIGIYIVLAEAVDDKGGTVSVVKAPLVVAARL